MENPFLSDLLVYEKCCYSYTTKLLCMYFCCFNKQAINWVQKSGDQAVNEDSNFMRKKCLDYIVLHHILP